MLQTLRQIWENWLVEPRARCLHWALSKNKRTEWEAPRKAGRPLQGCQRPQGSGVLSQAGEEARWRTVELTLEPDSDQKAERTLKIKGMKGPEFKRLEHQAGPQRFNRLEWRQSSCFDLQSKLEIVVEADAACLKTQTEYESIGLLKKEISFLGRQAQPEIMSWPDPRLDASNPSLIWNNRLGKLGAKMT